MEEKIYCKFAEERVSITEGEGKFFRCPGCHMKKYGEEKVTMLNGGVLTCGEGDQSVTEITALVVANRRF